MRAARCISTSSRSGSPGPRCRRRLPPLAATAARGRLPPVAAASHRWCFPHAGWTRGRWRTRCCTRAMARRHLRTVWAPCCGAPPCPARLLLPARLFAAACCCRRAALPAAILHPRGCMQDGPAAAAHSDGGVPAAAHHCRGSGGKCRHPQRAEFGQECGAHAGLPALSHRAAHHPGWRQWRAAAGCVGLCNCVASSGGGRHRLRVLGVGGLDTRCCAPFAPQAA